MDKLNFFSEYLIKEYGRQLYRIPIMLPFSCPNRVNNNGEGCIFCADDGAKARHLRHNLNLKEQVASGIEYAQNRYKATAPYIAYFQAYTNTYSDAETIRKYYEEVLAEADFKVIIVATRPDCLDDKQILNYLAELNERYELIIELGVQTSNDKTLDFIKRGHHFDSVITAVNRLHKMNIKCAAHVILGLPNEDINDWLKTAEGISKLPFFAVKIHNLLVLKKTPLAKIFHDKSAQFNITNEYEYADALRQFIRKLPNDWNLMRITADAPENQVVVPKWWMAKGQFLEFFNEFYYQNDAMPASAVKTTDGSFTLYHPKYKQHFHSLAGAETESIQKFVQTANLAKRLKYFYEKGHILRLLDIGFGLGYNAFAALDCAIKNDLPLEIVSLEFDSKTLVEAVKIMPQNRAQIINQLLEHGYWDNGVQSIKIIFDDARNSVKNFNKSEIFDVVFMDGFSPDKNPELWSYDFILELKKKQNHQYGIICSYSSTFPVGGAFLRCGLQLRYGVSYGRNKGGFVAICDVGFEEKYLKNNNLTKVSEKDINIILKSTAGVVYRDFSLKMSAKKIINYRNKVVKKLRVKGVPRWFK
ncbi:TIGR01212 family radical SAM protein [Lentisphaerota bacterium WC36G]|nr:TIGR01212 family radical SAM protein [Lentisphaerae bacterium WC36]